MATTLSTKARRFVRRVIQPIGDAQREVSIDPREADRLRAKAHALRARATKLEEEAAALKEDAEGFERAADVLAAAGTHGLVRIKKRTLPDFGSNRSIGSMDVDTTGQPARVKLGAARARRKHPAQRALYEHGKTVTSIAAELGEGRPRVNAWFADGEANRPIPRRHAERLRDRYGIPLSAWARIAD